MRITQSFFGAPADLIKSRSEKAHLITDTRFIASTVTARQDVFEISARSTARRNIAEDGAVLADA